METKANPAKAKRRLNLPVKILIGMIAGIILGVIFGEKIGVIEFVGTIFMRLLRMCIYPLVLFSIMRSVANVQDIVRLRKVGIYFLLYVVIGSVICALIGAASCLIFKPGLGLDLSALESAAEATSAAPAGTNLLETIINWIPENPFNAMSSGDMLQIIIFAVFFGVLLSKMREKVDSANTLFTVIDALDELMNRMVSVVLETAPYGVCALVAVMVGTTGLQLIAGIGTYILAYYAALAAIVVLLYPALIKFGAKVSIRRYFKNILPVILMSATTMSSTGTLPVTMETTKKRCGVADYIVDLLAPIGATVNMQGAAASQCTYAFFTMYLYGMDLSAGQLIFIIVLGAAMAVGGSGVPGGGVIMCSVMLSIMGMPQTIVPIIAGIFTLLDFGATVLNVLGDTIGMLMVARYTGELDEDVFYGRMEAAIKK